MKDLYLHIGLPKTGSTSIQYFCLANNGRLMDENLYYHPIWEGFYGHSHLSSLRVRSMGINTNAYENLKSFVNDFKQSPCTRALLSEEVFCEQHILEFRQLFDEFNTKVILYFRSPALLDASAVQFEMQSSFLLSENIDIIKTISFDNFSPFERSYMIYEKVYHNWIKHLNPDQLILKDFDEICSSGDLIDDFMATLDIDRDETMQDARVNSALKLDYILFLAHANFIPLTPSERQILFQNIDKISSQDKSITYSLLPDYEVGQLDHHRAEFFEKMGQLIGSQNFVERGIQKLRQLPKAPYLSLPAHRQHQIFSNLDEPVKFMIAKNWPSGAYGDRSRPLLPDLVTERAGLAILERWYQRINELAH